MHVEAFLSVLPVVVWFAGAVVVSYFFVVFVKHRQRTRRSSFIRHLLRGPGESVRQQLNGVDGKLDLHLFLLVFSLPLLIVLLVARQEICSAPLYPLSWMTVLPFFIGVVLLSFLLVRIFRLLVVQRKFFLDLDCKLAVGQELNLLMRQGCSVFHDVPGDGSTIDHVLVGPSGVYAVATKGRVKPKRKRGNIEARVFYDGKELAFPSWIEAGPVAQIKWQAVWLADWLSRVVGEEVAVKGIIFLPGWTVEASGRKEISVVNEKSAPLLGKPRGDEVLSEESRQRIAYQVEQRCRTMTGDGG